MAVSETVNTVSDAVQPPKLSQRYADESYKLFSKVSVADPTPEEALKIRNKCLWRILPFLCLGYHLMYVDKQTVRIPFQNCISNG